MISFRNVSALQDAMPKARSEILREGKLNVGGNEYRIDADTQQFICSEPTNNTIGRFFDGVGKLYRESNLDSVAKAITKSVFDNELGQTQCSQTRSSVKHDQVLFKGAGLKTPSDVLNAFGQLDTQIIKSNNDELNQLAERALSEVLLSSFTPKKPNSDVKLNVCSFHPKLQTLTLDINKRLDLFVEGLEKNSADIFVAPEYYWNASNNNLNAFSTESFTNIREKLTSISRQYPDTLIIPGSFVIIDEKNAKNISFVIKNGELIADLQGNQIYQKLDLDYEKKKFNLEREWLSAGKGAFDFTYNEWNIRLEICSDNGVIKKGEWAPDLGIVIAANIGGKFCSTPVGGSTIFVDANGTSVEKVKEKIEKKQDPLFDFLPKTLQDRYQGKFVPASVYRQNIEESLLKEFRPQWFK